MKWHCQSAAKKVTMAGNRPCGSPVGNEDLQESDVLTARGVVRTARGVVWATRQVARYPRAVAKLKARLRECKRMLYNLLLLKVT